MLWRCARAATAAPPSTWQVLSVVPISQSSAKQRAGRAGRTCEGEVWRLYTEAQHAALAAEQLAEIHRTDLANVVLCLKQIGEQ